MKERAKSGARTKKKARGGRGEAEKGNENYFELALTASSLLFSSRRSSKIEPREIRERAKSGAMTKKKFKHQLHSTDQVLLSLKQAHKHQMHTD